MFCFYQVEPKFETLIVTSKMKSMLFSINFFILEKNKKLILLKT